MGTSSRWSSHTGAGFRKGGWGIGAGVEVGGTMGPVFVFQYTRIALDGATREMAISPIRPTTLCSTRAMVDHRVGHSMGDWGASSWSLVKLVASREVTFVFVEIWSNSR